MFAKKSEIGAIKDKKQIKKVKNTLRRNDIRDYLCLLWELNWTDG